MEAFPEAKVVLIFPEPDRWSKSFMTLSRTLDGPRTVAALMPGLRWFMRFGVGRLENQFGGSPDRESCVRVFSEHNAEVKRIVPPERLLVFRVRESWRPLCPFLGCAVSEGIFLPPCERGRSDAHVHSAAALRGSVGAAHLPDRDPARTPGVVAALARRSPPARRHQRPSRDHEGSRARDRAPRTPRPPRQLPADPVHFAPSPGSSAG
jgi:hypothetical protein